MADDNKPLKYMRYAIGEIVLVVIGILIALQINNWNESQSDKKKEIKLLRALQKEFQENSNRYMETIEEQKLVVNYCYSLVQCMEKKDISFKRDSIGLFIARGALNYYRAEPIMGTYEALTGSGDINLIDNESLKSNLASFSSEIIQGFEDETASMDLLSQLTHEFSATLEPLLSSKLRKEYGLKLSRNPDVHYQNEVLSAMYRNPNIMTPLIRRIVFERNRLELQNKMLAISNETLDLINSELN